MIARDEERCIARALSSARDFVDEMIVLDTGSVDATVDIATAEGARVESYAWRDDFAGARNAALELSSATFNFVLDADEWIEACGASLRQWCLASTSPLGWVRRRDLLSPPTALMDRLDSTEQQIRVLRHDIRYTGRVHEQPDSTGPATQLDLVIGHDGYLDEHNAAKAGRNERILRSRLESSCEPYLLFQLAKDLEVQRRFAEAAVWYKRALERSGPGVPWRHALVVRSVFTLKAAGLHRQALEVYAAEIEHWPDSPDLSFAAGDLFLDLAIAHPAQAPELIGRAAQAWLRCLEIGDRPDLPGSVRGRGSHLAQHNLDVVAQNWSAAAVGAAIGEARPSSLSKETP